MIIEGNWPRFVKLTLIKNRIFQRLNSTYDLKKHHCDKCSFATNRKFNLERHYKRQHEFDNDSCLHQLKAHHQQRALQAQFNQAQQLIHQQEQRPVLQAQQQQHEHLIMEMV